MIQIDHGIFDTADQLSEQFSLSVAESIEIAIEMRELGILYRLGGGRDPVVPLEAVAISRECGGKLTKAEALRIAIGMRRVEMICAIAAGYREGGVLALKGVTFKL